MKRYFSTMGMCLAVVLMTSLPNAQAGSKTVTRAWKPLKNIGPAITPPKIQIPQLQQRDSHFQDAASDLDLSYEISAPNVFIKSAVPGTSQRLPPTALYVCENDNVVDIFSRFAMKLYIWNPESRNYDVISNGISLFDIHDQRHADDPRWYGLPVCGIADYYRENNDPNHPYYVEVVAPEGAFLSRPIVETSGISYADVHLRANTSFRFYCPTHQGETVNRQWDSMPVSSEWKALDEMPYARNPSYDAANHPACGPNATQYKTPGLIGE